MGCCFVLCTRKLFLFWILFKKFISFVLKKLGFPNIWILDINQHAIRVIEICRHCIRVPSLKKSKGVYWTSFLQTECLELAYLDILRRIYASKIIQIAINLRTAGKDRKFNGEWHRWCSRHLLIHVHIYWLLIGIDLARNCQSRKTVDMKIDETCETNMQKNVWNTKQNFLKDVHLAYGRFKDPVNQDLCQILQNRFKTLNRSLALNLNFQDF